MIYYGSYYIYINFIMQFVLVQLYFQNNYTFSQKNNSYNFLNNLFSNIQQLVINNKITNL